LKFYLKSFKYQSNLKYFAHNNLRKIFQIYVEKKDIPQATKYYNIILDEIEIEREKKNKSNIICNLLDSISKPEKEKEIDISIAEKNYHEILNNYKDKDKDKDKDNYENNNNIKIKQK
jgi:hypothetical protein